METKIQLDIEICCLEDLVASGLIPDEGRVRFSELKPMMQDAPILKLHKQKSIHDFQEGMSIDDSSLPSSNCTCLFGQQG